MKTEEPTNDELEALEMAIENDEEIFSPETGFRPEDLGLHVTEDAFDGGQVSIRGSVGATRLA